MIGFACDRLAVGQPVSGLIATTNRQSIGAAIDDILLVAETISPEEMRERVVVYLPLRE